MAELLVLGEGWLGSEVARAGEGRAGIVTVDPGIDPVLRRRDTEAARALRDLIASSGATSVVNACGRLRGTSEELDDANAQFPRWLCEALDGLAVRLVHIGSAAEYGDPGSDRPIEESFPGRPTGDYAVTKAAGTDAVLAARAAGLEAVVARVFNLVGHPIPAVSPVHEWLTALSELGPDGGAVTVWWPPTTRDFVRISDAAAALIDLALLDAPPEQLPAIVNVCSGVGLTYGDIVVALGKQLGIEVTISSLDRPGIPAVVGDPRALLALTGRRLPMDLPLLARTVLPDTALGDRPGGSDPSSGGEAASGR